jgi:hypothetical protein
MNNDEQSQVASGRRHQNRTHSKPATTTTATTATTTMKSTRLQESRPGPLGTLGACRQPSGRTFRTPPNGPHHRSSSTTHQTDTLACQMGRRKRRRRAQTGIGWLRAAIGERTASGQIKRDHAINFICAILILTTATNLFQLASANESDNSNPFKANADAPQQHPLATTITTANSSSVAAATTAAAAPPTTTTTTTTSASSSSSSSSSNTPNPLPVLRRDLSAKLLQPTATANSAAPSRRNSNG